MMYNPVDILVITAHPDDAEFGVAGTMARWMQSGKSAAYVICTNGEKGTSDRTVNPQDLKKQRQAEQRAAAEVLGVGQVLFLNYPDQEIEDTPAFRKHIVEIIRTFQPHTVVSSDPYRRYLWHRDHRIMGQVVMDAVFPYARDHLAYPDLLQKGLEPHKVKEILFFGTEDINYRSDITNFFDLKRRALCCHESQVKEIGVESLTAMLRRRGRQMAAGKNFELAEAFHRVTLPA